MSLFDGFRKKKTDVSTQRNEWYAAAPEVKPDEAESNKPSKGYYFENALELAIYGKLHSNDIGGGTVYWLEGNDYLEQFKKGYQLFERGKYAQAIDEYRKCLNLNPIGISARFEMCEAYIKMRDWNAARKALLDMKDYLIDEKQIARFYRRLGFMETEKGNYKLAAACFNYSLNYEKHPAVAQELQYIKSKGGFGAANGNPETVITNASLPLLTKTTLQ